MLAYLLLVALAASIGLEHADIFEPARRRPTGGGSDWRLFDQRTLEVARVIDGDTLEIRAPDGQTVPVRLIGVDAPELRPSEGGPPDYWAERATDYARARADGQPVLLKLEPTQTRDRYQRLLAYVYLSDTEMLNLALVRDGQGYADRRFKHTFRPQFEMAENEARKKQRGLWKEVTEEQMPQWRREWLREFRRR